MKSAYSTNIKERHDHSTAIMDPRGRLVVQAEQSLPIHIASMTGLMSSLLLDKYGRRHSPRRHVHRQRSARRRRLTHLPDINLALPVFAGAAGLIRVRLQHRPPRGCRRYGAQEAWRAECPRIYQEGLRIPVVKLFREGALQQDLLDLLLLNVRVPEGTPGRLLRADRGLPARCEAASWRSSTPMGRNRSRRHSARSSSAPTNRACATRFEGLFPTASTISRT